MKNQKSKQNNSGFEVKYVLSKPHISEKATLLSEKGFYVFKIASGANKREVKEEVEKKYKVEVVSVRTIKIPSKKKRTGKIEGKKRGYRKAVVKLKKGQTIDLMIT